MTNIERPSGSAEVAFRAVLWGSEEADERPSEASFRAALPALVKERSDHVQEWIDYRYPTTGRWRRLAGGGRSMNLRQPGLTRRAASALAPGAGGEAGTYGEPLWVTLFADQKRWLSDLVLAGWAPPQECIDLAQTARRRVDDDA